MGPFHRIEHKKKSTCAAEQIVEAIRQGRYRAGDRLPPEREIAEKMGISRPLVREALSALQLVGIVESRPGDGTYVRRDISGSEEAYPAFTLLEESESLHEAFEARRVLEEGIVALACVKAEPEDLAALHRALAALDAAARAREFEAFNGANREFHLALVQAVHNSLLVRALEPLVEVMRQRLPQRLREAFYSTDRQRFEETFALHRQILDAVEARDRPAAVQAMREHFDILERDLNE